MKVIKQCTICGASFETTNIHAKYCSDPCRKKASRKSYRQAKAKEKEELERKKNMQQSIIDIAVLARQAGMTYGQYVAKMGL